MKEYLKILIAAGFSNAEIAEFTSQNRVDYIANGIRQGIATGCDPTIHRSKEFANRDPFDTMASMSAEERRELREYATASFEEFIGEIPDASVSQVQVTEAADRSLAFFASKGIYPTKVPL